MGCLWEAWGMVVCFALLRFVLIRFELLRLGGFAWFVAILCEVVRFAGVRGFSLGCFGLVRTGSNLWVRLICFDLRWPALICQVNLIRLALFLFAWR